MKQRVCAAVTALLTITTVGCGGDMEDTAVLPDDAAETAEAAQAIQTNAWNGNCAQSLSLYRHNDWAYLGQLGKTQPMYVYWPLQGQYANVLTYGNGIRGWVLKDWVSRNCLPVGWPWPGGN